MPIQDPNLIIQIILFYFLNSRPLISLNPTWNSPSHEHLHLNSFLLKKITFLDHFPYLNLD